MITINLRPGARRQVQKGPAFGDLQERLKGLSSKVKEPWLALAIVAWVAVLGFFGFIFVSTSTQLSTLEPKLEAARQEHTRYQDFLKQKRREERVRDSILAQIGTIAGVDQDRYTWSHILDDIGSAMPEYTWLTEIAAVGGAVADSTAGPQPINLRIVGRTSDLQNYTSLLRHLEDSPWLYNVLPVEAKTVVEGNRALTAFTIQATFTRADSTHIRTVPVLESVVR